MSATADWGRLAELGGERVFRAARTLAPDDDTAWDCVQEAFLTAITTRRVEELRDPVEWLCGVARNHARHSVRSRSRFGRLVDRVADRLRSTRAVVDADGREALHLALSRLSPRQREAVVLRYFGRMSVGEVARATRTTEVAARARIHRGLVRLRRLLGGSALLVLLVREGARAALDPAALVAASAAVGATAAALSTTGLAVAAAVVLLLAGGVLLTFGFGRSPVRADLDRRPGGGGPAPAAPVEPDASLVAAAPSTPGAERAGPLVAAPARGAAASAGRREESAPLPAEGRGGGGATSATEPGSGAKTIAVRDLADGGPIPGVAIRVLAADGREVGVVRADEKGRIEVPGEGATLAPEGDRWHAPTYRPGEVARDGTLWLYALRQVLVKVRRRTHAKEGDVTVDALCAGFRKSTAARPTPAPWHPAWLGAHGLAPTPFVPLGHESYSGMVPAIEGTVVRARAPGAIPAVDDLKWTAGGARAVLDLSREAFVVRGRVSGRTGSEPEGARVELFVFDREPLPGVRRERLFLLDEPFFVVPEEKGTARVVYRAEGKVDGDGGFTIECRAIGDDATIVAVSADGRRAAWRPIRLRSPPDELELTLLPVRGEIAVERNGAPLAGFEATVLDLTGRMRGWHGTLDRNGRMAGARLDSDARAFLLARGPKGEVIRRIFDGRDAERIEVDRLPDVPDPGATPAAPR